MPAAVITNTFSAILISGFLLISVAVAGQKASTNISAHKKPHIELEGYPGRDRVRVDEILNAARIRSVDPGLTVLGFRYTLWGPCIGAGVHFNNSEKDRFKRRDHEYLSLLKSNDQILIDSITATDANGKMVNLRTAALVIVKSDH